MAKAIRYISRAQIDITKWDQCIHEASNGLIYAYSFYLDAMAKNWDALVQGDYEAVMPLPWNKKYGIYYLYQPPFTASLGVFGNHFTNETVHYFIQSIPAKFKLIEIDLNKENLVSSSSGFSVTRNNYVLNLNKPYEELLHNYRDTIKRNCRKAQQLNCHYSDAVDIDKVIQLSKEQMGKISNLSAEDYHRFKKLFFQLLQKENAMACGVYTETDSLVASCVYFFSHNRAYYILVGNHPNGKTIGASHYLIDRFIFAHAGKNLLLDFEGSDNRNLAFFYSSFGATVESYPALRINRLPWWVNLAKKLKV